MKTIDTFKMLFLASTGTMLLTLFHHAYGAAIYDEPFRLHVAWFSVPVIVALALTYRIYRRRPRSKPGRISLWIFIGITVLISVGAIGIFEGGYNHVLKNILYFGGARQETFDRLYSPIYELPNNFLFEFTGILQFVTACAALYYIFRLRPRKLKNKANNA
jgi:drug/metabolite transporter (DMT)-like permease